MTFPAAIHPLPLTWPYAPVFWLVIYWAFIPEYQLTLRAKKSAARADSPDRGSLKLILVTNRFAGLAAFAVCWIAATAVPSAWLVPCFWIGIAMLVAGSLLRRHCFRMLGEFFTGDVNARAQQPVIDRGAYRWIRHPSYTAGMLLFTGIGVALGNWLSMIIMAGTMALVYTYRVRVEERALLAAIGEPYRRFMAGRKRFIPYVF